MAIPLLRGLGLRSTVRVIRALADVHTREPARPADRGGPPALNRKQFLRLGAGVAAAAGLLLAGKTPALANPESAEAQRWVEAQAGRLPRRYEDVISYSVEYRKAIFDASTPVVRSELWTAQLQRCRTSPGLSANLVAALDRAFTFASDTTNYMSGAADRPDVEQSARGVQDAAIDAFGKEQAYAIIGQGTTCGPLWAFPCDGKCGH